MNTLSINKMENYIKKIFDLEIEIEVLKQRLAVAEFQTEIYRMLNSELTELSKKMIAFV